MTSPSSRRMLTQIVLSRPHISHPNYSVTSIIYEEPTRRYKDGVCYVLDMKSCESITHPNTWPRHCMYCQPCQREMERMIIINVSKTSTIIAPQVWLNVHPHTWLDPWFTEVGTSSQSSVTSRPLHWLYYIVRSLSRNPTVPTYITTFPARQPVNPSRHTQSMTRSKWLLFPMTCSSVKRVAWLLCGWLKDVSL